MKLGSHIENLKVIAQKAFAAANAAFAAERESVENGINDAALAAASDAASDALEAASDALWVAMSENRH